RYQRYATGFRNRNFPPSFERRRELHPIFRPHFRRRDRIGGIVIERAKNRGIAAIQQTIKIEIPFIPLMPCSGPIIEKRTKERGIISADFSIKISVAVERIPHQDV